MSIYSFLFDATQREIGRARGLASQIGRLRLEMQQLTDEQMRAKTGEFRDRLARGETLEDLLVEAFALVREATWRQLGKRQVRFRVYHEGRSVPDDTILPLTEADRFEEGLKQRNVRYDREWFMGHFDVQMMGATLLHWGRVAEMKTGEGKTQVAAPALYLNALEGKGAHLLTHNDYLARRDRDWMAPIFESLGLTVGVIQHDMEPQDRQAAYDCDITYAVNSEVGFDYLRDNTVDYADWLVLRDLHFAIVDEADSLLIDEARTPLILAGMGAKPTELYRKVDRVIVRLTQDTDYILDEKGKSATLTEDGVHKLERELGVTNLSDPENLELFQHVNAALRAHACYKRDVDYAVRDGKVIIVDEFTGRLMYGRRYSEGLHQAIEAKEKVVIERESITTASITHQNFFRLYQKRAGMTGTAKTEEPELIKVYDTPVAVIPTHRPMVRKDHSDVIYKTQEAKYHGIVAEILKTRSLGQPTLVGTRSIDVSERLSERLKSEKLQLLAQLIILEYALIERKDLTPEERREFARALKQRLGEVERDLRHLEAAVAKFDQGGLRVAQPEEQRRVEHRMNRTAKLAEDIMGLIQKLEGTNGIGNNETRRMAEIICFQQLDEVPLGRPAALLRALGIDPDVTATANVIRLADIIGLEQKDHESLREVLARGIPHRVLNAKYHEMEAHIIANAGRSGALTIATNMAGRGVDILLGGNPTEVMNELLQRDGIDPDQANPEQRAAALAEAQEICAKDKEKVLALGGLHILGTERHESRRIDNQLRGRSGRQGDPGSSRFYVSFEDELMRLFGPERLEFWLSKWPENEPIEAKITSRMIETAQKKVEAHNFEVRKHRLQYDDIMNHQRSLIYEQRRRVLLGEDLRNTVYTHMRELVEARAKEFANPDIHIEDWNFEALHQALAEVYPIGLTTKELAQYTHPDELVALLQEDIENAYAAREEQAGEEQIRELERLVTLRVVSARWIDHLAAMEDLEEGIGLRGYSGVDPLILYRKESYEYWNRLVEIIRDDIIRYLFRVEIRPQETEEQKRARLGLGQTPVGVPVQFDEADGMAAPLEVDMTEAPERTRSALKSPPREAQPRRRMAPKATKVGRNDPCPCGSGKKYKKCCGK